MEPSKPKPRKVRIIDEENNARFQQFVNKIKKRFISGEYDINKTRRANNIQSIQREQTRLTQKRERGEVVNEENVTTLEDLLELIENDNNEGNRSGNSDTNEDENNMNEGNGVVSTRAPAGAGASAVSANVGESAIPGNGIAKKPRRNYRLLTEYDPKQEERDRIAETMAQQSALVGDTGTHSSVSTHRDASNTENIYANLPPLEKVGKGENKEMIAAVTGIVSRPENNTAATIDARATNIVINPCAELFDPCTREPIANIQALERRVREIKLQSTSDISSANILPSDTKTRLDLLLFMLNRSIPDESLFNYNNSGELYESYWDIVFSMGLHDSFPINEKFFMYNGKIENLTGIDDPNFIANPIEYLGHRKIKESSKSGASDITFVYKENTLITNADECSAPSHVTASASCSRTATLRNSTTTSKPQFFFCSSKFYKSDNMKTVDKYDIQNIYIASKLIASENYNKKIILVVKDKHSVTSKLKSAIRKYISEEATYIYGMSDLLSCLTKFYDLIHSKHESDIKITRAILMNILHIETHIKPLMNLRLHQHIAINKMHDAIVRFKSSGSTENNRFLVGIVPRGGKTYIAGGIINALNPKRVVVLLGAKSETLSQFKTDLFDHFQNFNEYTCIDVLDKTASETENMTAIDLDKKYIFIMSIELYKSESRRQLLIDLKGEDSEKRADLFICDEAHLKTTTEKAEVATHKGTSTVARSKTARAIATDDDEPIATENDEDKQLKEIDKLLYNSAVPIVYMTGTYIKPLNVFKIPNENVIIWDYQDIQYAKELIANEKYFKDTFGDAYDRAIKLCIEYGQTYESIQTQYRKFPELQLLTTQFTPDAKAAFLEQPEGGGFATLSHLFEVKKDFNPNATDPSNWYTGFTNYRGLMRMINYFSPPRDHILSLDSTRIDPISSVIQSVDRIAQRIGDRLAFVSSDFVTHTQLWFLPQMHGHPLFKRMCALAGLIFQNEWFRKYFDIMAVSSSVDWNIPGAVDNSIIIPSKDNPESCGTFSWYTKPCPTTDRNTSLKQCLLNQEALSRSKGKGLIILAQNMLHLGISLPCVDIVVLLDTGEKLDERVQKMYRALTESTNKKAGYIIDMNYFRTVTALMNYQIASSIARGKQRRGVTENIPSLFNNILETYSIDSDKPIVNFKNTISGETIPELQRILVSSKPSENTIRFINAGKALNANIEEVVNKLYTSSYDEFLRQFINNHKSKITVREEGTDVRRAEHDRDTNTGSISRINSIRHKLFNARLTEAQKKAAFIELFKTTLKLGAFATNSLDISRLEHDLGNNADLRDTLYDTLVKRGTIVPNGAKKDDIIDIMIRPNLQKMIAEGRGGTYHNMRQKIEELSMYPKNVEEVLEYILKHLAPKDEERLKYGEIFTPMTLVHDMLDTIPSEVWNDKSLKWLDPANGMGNFPIAVFLRLYFGFRTVDNKYIGLGKGESEGESESESEGEVIFNPGLTEEIKSNDARRKHIVEKMLYMVELNSKNIAISKNLFKKLAPGVVPNIIRMHSKDGFLANVEMKFQFGVIDKFDIIMGNPPFNTPKMDGKSTGNSIWPNFVIKSNMLLNNNGYLLFVHPPGWKKPTDQMFNPEKFADGNYTRKIYPGQVWQVLRESGVFKFIYTNDQYLKGISEEYLPHFPAVDYYLYQKGEHATGCDIKNVFLGKISYYKGLKLNYNLNYLPNLITKETIDILQKVTSKEGDKTNFKAGFDPRGFKRKIKGAIKYIYDASSKGPNYAYYSEKTPNVDISKIILNENGGIKGYYCKFIHKSEQVGVLHHTLLFPIERSRGKNIEKFFNSDLVKFIFLITQYVSGKMQTNEKLVANSITLPPDEITDYYDFFDIAEHKKYIEDTLTYFNSVNLPKRTTRKVKGGGSKIVNKFTIKRTKIRARGITQKMNTSYKNRTRKINRT